MGAGAAVATGVSGASGGWSGVPSGAVVLREVGPRDGLQGEAPLPVASRVALIEALLAAGVRRLEVCAFVSPKAVPAMAGAAEVLTALGRPEGVVRAALVPNLRGAQLALEAGVDELTMTVSASAVYSERNVRMTPAESLAVVEQVVEAARQRVGVGVGVGVGGRGVPVDVVLSCCFGSPYEGEIAPGAVAAMARRCVESGATAVTLADTTGMATPRRVDDVLDAVWGVLGEGADVGLHLHETRGTGLVNAYRGMQRGVRRFDTSVGGLGGSPFAAGAAGNVATEAMVFLCDDLGLATGVHLGRLCEAARLAEGLVGRTLPSAVARAGGRDGAGAAGEASDAVV